MPRPIYEIAAEIKADWTKPYFGAVPYLDAMQYVENVDSPYGVEDGRTQILYFLSNATTWRGDTARRVKKELKGMVGLK